jgi:hypothetical protein
MPGTALRMPGEMQAETACSMIQASWSPTGLHYARPGRLCSGSRQPSTDGDKHVSSLGYHVPKPLSRTERNATLAWRGGGATARGPAARLLRGSRIYHAGRQQ